MIHFNEFNHRERWIQFVLAIRTRTRDPYRCQLTALERYMLGSLLRTCRVELASGPAVSGLERDLGVPIPAEHFRLGKPKQRTSPPAREQ